MAGLKPLLFRIFDVCCAPLTALAGLHLRTIRRYGIVNFPTSRKIFLALGMFPIRRHFYDPHFHPGDLRMPLDAARPMPGIDLNGAGQRAILDAFDYNGEILRFASTDDPVNFSGHAFRLDNVMFGPGDVDYYYNMVRHLKPRRIVEIGSGYSTLVALEAIANNRREDPEYACALTAVEPYPWFTDAGVDVRAQKVEEAPRELFTELDANDILFIDSSHVIRPQGDVLLEFLELLPALKPGVVVHVHDVFTPFEYPAEWLTEWHTFWNEQYLLEALLTENDRFEVLGALFYLHKTQPKTLHAKCPLLAANPNARPQSFWLRRK
jgi:hypothetical protein